jgi:LacI family transcriptional regulator
MRRTGKVGSQPSLRDIAARTGVTTMSVSRALRGSPQISEAKRSEILRVADELGYRPDPQVSKLMSLLRTSKARRVESVIGLINTRPERGFHLREPHLRRLHDGIAARAEALGYKLEEYWLADPDIPPRRQQAILRARGIEGLILLPVDPKLDRIELDLADFAIAAVGRSHRSVPCDRATPNHFNAVRIAISNLTRLGFKRLGLTLFDGINDRTDRRYSSAWLDHQSEIPASQRIPLHISTTWNPSAFRKWFERHRPSVILTQGEHIRGFLQRDLGLHVPRDLGYVNLNLLPGIDRSAGIDQNYPAVGAAAVDILAGLLNRGEHGLPATPRTVTIDGSWTPGDSLEMQGAGSNE